MAAETSARLAEGEIADLATALVQENEALGFNPGGWTPSARWKTEVDIPDGVLGRAGEAVLEGMDRGKRDRGGLASGLLLIHGEPGPYECRVPVSHAPLGITVRCRSWNPGTASTRIE